MVDLNAQEAIQEVWRRDSLFLAFVRLTRCPKASYLVEEGQALDVSISIGLTEDSPDFVVRLGIPFGK